MQEKRFVYLDNAATTPMSESVISRMTEIYKNNYGNASAIYKIGRESKVILDEARESVAKSLGCDVREVYFTGCGTESDNWAIKGFVKANPKKGKNIITTKIEHHAILHTCAALEKEGYTVTYLDVDEFGLVNPDDLEKAITPETALISIMYANNEVGTIEPIKELCEIAHAHGITFHTDAVQAVGSEKINFHELGADMMSLSAHKFHGPKGVGALIVKKGTKLVPYLDGGAQERKMRGGTENIAGIAGLAVALAEAVTDIDKKQSALREKRDYLIKRIKETIPYIKFNGHPEKRLNNNVNFCFEFIEGESLLLLLDMNGICASSGSACTSGSLDPSHVLLAMGIPHEIAHGSLRLTLSTETTKEDIDYTVEKLDAIVKRLRAMSPLYNEKIEK